MSPYLWLIVAAAMAAIEIASSGLITVWFVVGALVAFVFDWAGASSFAQVVVFLVVSLACLFLLRPLALKHRAQGRALEETPVGRNAVVVERIDNAALEGRVETPDHMTWAALTTDGRVLEPGTRVRVVDRRSIKLVVEPIGDTGQAPAPDDAAPTPEPPHPGAGARPAAPGPHQASRAE